MLVDPTFRPSPAGQLLLWHGPPGMDGIIGQGLRVLVLVTTNEPLGRLHPAVARPGSRAVRIEFDLFGADEARAWLARRGIAAAGVVPRTLAELYALAEGHTLPERRPIGFVRNTLSTRE